MITFNTDTARQIAAAALRDSHLAAQRLLDESFRDLWRAFELVLVAVERGSHIYICGNGGSAADAQHFAAELVVRLDEKSHRRPLPATALSTDTSILTAAANDFGFEQIFARQLEARGKAGDLLVVLSTSGNSRNLIVAAQTARRLGMTTVALLGKGGGPLREAVDGAVIVPSDNTQRIQEVHALCLHLWCEWLEAALTQT